MRLSDFDYELPEELIAQSPPAERTDARMLVLHRATGACELLRFPDLVGFLQAGDCVVMNDTRVIPARVLGRRSTGGRVEALLLRPLSDGHWESMLRPGRRLHAGERIQFENSEGGCTVVGRLEGGTFELAFDTDDVESLLREVGSIPLPPYIRRAAGAADAERYQTVFARAPGAVAAPTAGLHFTDDVLREVRDRGVHTAMLTLHVGPGTFQPVKVEDVRAHRMHSERYELPVETAETINSAHARGNRVLAVGTTSVRVLESCADAERPGCVRASSGETTLFLHPPKKPRVADALLTNFHLPRSTLLMLVCTFAAPEHVLAAYRLAVRERFRFYSYGDCMLLI